MNAAGQISTRFGIEDSKTKRDLAAALSAALDDGRPRVILWREWHAGPGYLIQVRPARETGAAVVVLNSLDAPIWRLDLSLLMDLFELTGAEAEIAAALFRNSGLGEIAAARGVQRETVRGQVKMILRKTGVASQKQLMVLLSKIALALPPISRPDRRPEALATSGSR